MKEMMLPMQKNIYGDKFTVEGRCVTGIGNNVMLDFGTFDFATEMPKQIRISGKSPLALNSIHLILTGADGEKRILCEFRTENADFFMKKERLHCRILPVNRRYPLHSCPEAILTFLISGLKSRRRRDK